MKKIRAILLLLIFTTIVGCGKNKLKEGEREYSIYCLARDENSLNSYLWKSDKKDKLELVNSMLEEMALQPDDVQNREAIKGFIIENTDI